LEVYGNEDRVQVRNLRGPWQAVSVLVHRLSEIDTPAFRDFLTRAATAFQDNIRRMQLKPEDVMPWTLNGERWHLSEKGFPVGKRVQWDRALLPQLLHLAREVESGLKIEWKNRSAITLRIPGISRSWAQWRTKESYGLDCRFLGKKGQFNLSQIEAFGVSPSISDSRADSDVLRLVFRHAEHMYPAKLKELLAEHLREFRQMFYKSST